MRTRMASSEAGGRLQRELQRLEHQRNALLAQVQQMEADREAMNARWHGPRSTPAKSDTRSR